MRVLLLAMFLVVMGGCESKQKGGGVMIALVIENEMDRHVVSSQVEFTPKSKIHVFGNVRANGGSSGNLGFPVNAKPVAMRLTYYVAKEKGRMEVVEQGEAEKVTLDVQLFDPKRNRANYPEYHLIIRPDGSIEQVRDIEEDEAAQRAADAAGDGDDMPDDLGQGE